jgi:hypothetical protein
MSEAGTYHCWVRVLRTDVAASSDATKDVIRILGVKLKGDFFPTAGPRPPRVKVAESKEDPKQPTGIFFSDDDASGDPKSDLVFDYGPAYANRKAAMTWIESAAGRLWVAESVNYMLFTLQQLPPKAVVILTSGSASGDES